MDAAATVVVHARHASDTRSQGLRGDAGRLVGQLCSGGSVGVALGVY